MDDGHLITKTHWSKNGDT